MAIVKALDVLRLWAQRSKTMLAIVQQAGPDEVVAKAQAEIEAGERIAAVIEAAQAWQNAHAALGTILMPIETREEADRANAALALDAETMTALLKAVAALDAEEGQAAAPQEEGEQQP